MPAFLKTRSSSLETSSSSTGTIARQHFDQRHFRAEAMEDGGELDAHRARRR